MLQRKWDKEKQINQWQRVCLLLLVQNELLHKVQMTQQIKQHTVSHSHPSLVYDKGSFLCNNSSGILSKMLPYISIPELLSQLAINSPGQTHPPDYHHPSAAECDGGCAVATMQCSVAIPASFNLSARDHINSTCHALLIGWDGKYGYPHQYLMRKGGRSKGRRSKEGSVEVVAVGCWPPGAWKAEKGQLIIP